jgi:hypothetical protein
VFPSPNPNLMKIAVVILLLLPFFSKAQNLTSYSDWKISEHGDAIWQKVIEDSTVNANDIVTYLKSLSYCTEVEERNGAVYAKVKNHMLDLKGQKGAGMLPYIYQNGKWNWAVVIDSKPGKYRVTVSGITFDSGNVDGGFGLEIPIAGNYDEVVLKKDRTSFKSGQLNYMFTFGQCIKKSFTIVKKSGDQDW